MSKRDVKDLLDKARKAGCRVEPTKGGHWKVYCPDRTTIVTVASTPSDHRSLQNAAALIRRGGCPDVRI